MKKLLSGVIFSLFFGASAFAQVTKVPIDYIDASGIVSGQLSIPAGTAGDPSIVFTDDDDGTGTGIYRSAANTLAFSTNGTIRSSLLLGWQTASGSAGLPAYGFLSDQDSGMYLIVAGNVGFTSGGVLVFDIEDTNAAGGSADLATISSTLGIMDGSDTVRALVIAPTNVNHTGTGNVLNALAIPAITSDPEALEVAIDIIGAGGTSWELAATFDAAVELNTYRQDFDGTCWRFEKADATAELVGDGDVNGAVCDGGRKSSCITDGNAY